MNPEAQRIAIAEACGLNPQDSPLDSPRANLKGWFTPAGYDDYRHSYPHGQMVKIIPDYLNDLNAMQEAVQTLNEQERVHFVDALLGAINREPDYNIDDDFCSNDGWKLVTATAAQRAEAFLEAKNLWTTGERKLK